MVNLSFLGIKFYDFAIKICCPHRSPQEPPSCFLSLQCCLFQNVV